MKLLNQLVLANNRVMTIVQKLILVGVLQINSQNMQKIVSILIFTKTK